MTATMPVAPPTNTSIAPPANGGMSTVTVKGLWANSSRFVLTALAVTLSVAFFSSILLLTDALRGTAADDVAAANSALDVVVRGEQLAEADSGPGAFSVATSLPAESLATIAAIDGVDEAIGVSSGYARVLDADGQPVDVGAFDTVGETWITNADANPYTLVEGVAPVNADEIAIERAVADDAGATVGSTVRLVTSSGTVDATVSGIVTYGTADVSPTTSTVLVAPDHAAEVLDATGFDRIVVELADGTPGTSASDAAVADFETALLALADPGLSDAEVVSGTAVVEELQQEIDDRTGFQTTFLLFFAVVALVAGSTIIYNTFVIAVQQRTRELALLRSIGASRQQVLRSVMGEAAVIGVVSSAIGAVAGIAGFYGLIALFEAIGLSFLSSSVNIAASSLTIAVLLGVVVTLGSAFFPARRAASIPPVAALRDAAVDNSTESKTRGRVGVTMLAAATVLSLVGWFGESGVASIAGLGLGFAGVIVAGPLLTQLTSATIGRGLDLNGNVTGRLARTNAARNPKRSASTAFSLTLGVSLMSLFTVVAGSLASAVSSDVENGLRVDTVVAALTDGPGAAVEVPRSLSGEVSAIDGVDLVSPVAVNAAAVDGELAVVGGVDTATISDAYDLDVTSGSIDDLGAGAVAVHTDTGLVVGDTIELAAATGGTEYTVVAVFDRLLPGAPIGPEYVVDRTSLDALTPGVADDYVLVGTDGSAEAADAIQLVVDEAGAVSRFSAQGYADSLGSFLDTFQNFVYSLLGVAVIIALVGIANTTVMSVNERTREIGMLRAVGATARQVRTMVRNEAFMLSIQGAVVGLALGIAGASGVFSLLAGDQGFSLTIPWSQLAVIGVLGAVAGVLAAAWPAWRASRRPPLDAMADD